MNDLFLELAGNPQARRVIKSLGLPIPMPEKLRRTASPWEERPLEDQAVLVGGGSELSKALAEALIGAGASVHLEDRSSADAFRALGEAWARPVRVLEGGALPEDARFRAMLFDATSIVHPDGLRGLYDFFHPALSKLERSGRVVVLGRPPEGSENVAQDAAAAALSGFVRSLAKEVGRRGATAQLVYVDPGAESRLTPVLRFFLSPRSAFVTGQALRITAEVRPASSVPTTRPLDGKVALVTGAARGIGAATATCLAREGAHVVCLDRPEDDGPASRVARSLGGSVLLADVSRPEAAKEIAQTLKERQGGVDIVVHNAGVTRDKTLARMKPELWDQTIAVNLTGILRMTEALLEGPLRDEGRLIALSSVAGIAGNTGQTNYAASKAGIIGFVQHLAPRLASRGVTVNAIAPGFIETRLTAAMPVTIREVARRLSALGQGGQPEDVAEVITFLASPGAHGVTDSVLRVCGGAFVGA